MCMKYRIKSTDSMHAPHIVYDFSYTITESGLKSRYVYEISNKIAEVTGYLQLHGQNRQKSTHIDRLLKLHDADTGW
ncbi:hypothetical protein PAE9249_01815 [Paenibacillus sp. CECT 9249]|nr:hypothetical protein PAE9249_01815 [Paenibacillus sp. CECT 9249]